MHTYIEGLLKNINCQKTQNNVVKCNNLQEHNLHIHIPGNVKQ